MTLKFSIELKWNETATQHQKCFAKDENKLKRSISEPHSESLMDIICRDAFCKRLRGRLQGSSTCHTLKILACVANTKLMAVAPPLSSKMMDAYWSVGTSSLYSGCVPIFLLSTQFEVAGAIALLNSGWSIIR